MSAAVLGGRVRWVSVGAVLALVLGAGGVLTSSAAGPVVSSSFVPIASCRLADTRPAPDNVGARDGALTADETLVVAVRGSNGRCVIPGDATAVSLNVTVVSPSSTSFLTVFPSDASPRPLASSMNWVAGQAPTANAVTSPLSADGRLSLYNLSGSVHVVVDVVGYYVPSTSGPQGPTGPQGLQGATGPAGACADGAAGADAPRLANEVYVSSSGGDFTSVQAALDAIGTTLPAASASNPYLIKVGPGVFSSTGNTSIELEDHVDIEGSGVGTTILRCDCATATVSGEVGSSTEIRELTIENTNADTDSYGLSVEGVVAGFEIALRDLEVVHTSGRGVNAFEVGLVLHSVRVEALFGVNLNYGDLEISDSTIIGGGNGVFVHQATGVIRDSTLRAWGAWVHAIDSEQLWVIDSAIVGSKVGTIQCDGLWHATTGVPTSC